MSTPNAEEVGRAYDKAHAEAEWAKWLRVQADQLERLAQKFLDADEPFTAGRVCGVRDGLRAMEGEAVLAAALSERVADAQARSYAGGAYMDVLNETDDHDQATAAQAAALQAVKP